MVDLRVPGEREPAEREYVCIVDGCGITALDSVTPLCPVHEVEMRLR